MRCFAYSFPFAFDKEKIIDFLSKTYNITEYEDVVCFKMQDNKILSSEGNVFIFLYGALVTWGLTEELESALCSLLVPYNMERLGAIDDDLYTYSYESFAKIKDDRISLPDRDILTQLSFSYGLAQSVKLGGFEETIQKIIEQTRGLPESLAKMGKIHLSRKETRKLIGRIFIDRTSINLHLELLDAPNFFWEHTELEPLHDMVTEYMGQTHRVSILNQRLGVIQELLDMLATELNNQHSSTLEWIIIVLIFIEVTVMFAKEIFHLV